MPKFEIKNVNRSEVVRADSRAAALEEFLARYPDDAGEAYTIREVNRSEQDIRDEERRFLAQSRSFVADAVQDLAREGKLGVFVYRGAHRPAEQSHIAVSAMGDSLQLHLGHPDDIARGAGTKFGRSSIPLVPGTYVRRFTVFGPFGATVIGAINAQEAKNSYRIVYSDRGYVEDAQIFVVVGNISWE